MARKPPAPHNRTLKSGKKVKVNSLNMRRHQERQRLERTIRRNRPFPSNQTR